MAGVVIVDALSLSRATFCDIVLLCSEVGITLSAIRQYTRQLLIGLAHMVKCKVCFILFVEKEISLED